MGRWWLVDYGRFDSGDDPVAHCSTNLGCCLQLAGPLQDKFLAFSFVAAELRTLRPEAVGSPSELKESIRVEGTQNQLRRGRVRQVLGRAVAPPR